PCGASGAPVGSSLVNGQTSEWAHVRLGLATAALVPGGCAWDGPMSTVAARSDFAREILHVYGIITWVAAVIALVVFAGLAWVLGFSVPGARYRAGERAPPARRPARRAHARGPRRDPQLLGPAARRQARRGARPAQPAHAHAGDTRRVLGPVRRVLRRLARQYGHARRRGCARGVRAVGRGA